MYASIIAQIGLVAKRSFLRAVIQVLLFDGLKLLENRIEQFVATLMKSLLYWIQKFHSDGPSSQS